MKILSPVFLAILGAAAALAGESRTPSALSEIEQRIADRDSVLAGSSYATKEDVLAAQFDVAALRLAAQSGDKKMAGLVKRSERQARKLLASSMERSFMEKWIGMKVSVMGGECRTLVIAYPLMSEVLAFQMRNKTDLSSTARDFGFEKIIFKSGFDSWTSDLGY